MDEFTKSTAAGQWADFCGYRLPCGYCRALEKPCPMGNSQTHITYKATGQNESYSATTKRDVPSTPTVTVANAPTIIPADPEKEVTNV